MFKAREDTLYPLLVQGDNKAMIRIPIEPLDVEFL